MTKTESLARKECANYDIGKCLGIMFRRVDGKLIMQLDGKYAGKKCKVDCGECSYFNHIVTKISNAN